jgi:hypothetical protein
MQDTDLVDHPSHYTIGGIEVIDILKAKSTSEEFRGHLRLTALAYILRAPFKGEALRDYKKAVKYLNWLVKELEVSSEKQSAHPTDQGCVSNCDPKFPTTLCPSAFGKPISIEELTELIIKNS